MHRSVQWEKNIVPEPLVPENGGSSPWWGNMLEMNRFPGAWQNPCSPFILFTPQRRGHREHARARFSASSVLSAQSASERCTYEGRGAIIIQNYAQAARILHGYRDRRETVTCLRNNPVRLIPGTAALFRTRWFPGMMTAAWILFSIDKNQIPLRSFRN